MKELNVSGFRVLHEQTAHPLVNVRAIVNAGSAWEVPGEHGIAHFLEHMFFKGTEDRPTKELNRLLAKYGTSNAYTDRDQTVYFIDTLEGTFKETFALLAEMMFHPRLDPEDFETERGVIIEEIQAWHDNPMSYFFRHFEPLLYNQDRFHYTTGDKPDVESHTLEKLKDFRSRFYVPSNMLFCVTGCVSEETVIKVVGEILIKENYDTSKMVSNPNDLKDFEPRNVHFTHPGKQAIMTVLTPGRYGRQYGESSAQGVTLNALGEDMHSILWNRLREELGLCYHVGTYGDLNHGMGASASYIFLDESNVDKAYEEILKIYKEIREHGVSEELLDVSRRNSLFGLARRIQKADMHARIFGDGYFLLEKFLSSFAVETAQIESVTNADIMEWANEFLVEEKMSKIVMTQEK